MHKYYSLIKSSSFIIGLPATPVFGHLQPGPKGGQITLPIQSPTSGIDRNFSDSEVFWFVITPVNDGIEGESVFHLSMDYQSGTFQTIIVDGLEEGESYVFNATAVNMYGSSLPTTSISVLAGVAPTLTCNSNERGSKLKNISKQSDIIKYCRHSHAVSIHALILKTFEKLLIGFKVEVYGFISIATI